MKKNVVAVIPARGGSKRVPFKNIRKIAGKPLIAYTIEAAKKAKTLDRIIVSTDSKRIAELAKKYGAEVPFLRPKNLATDNAHTSDVIKHAVEYLERKERYPVHTVVTLQPTSPFRRAEDIDRCVKKLLKTDCDVVVTLREARSHPLWTRKLKGDISVPFFKTKKDYTLLESQQLPKAYENDGSIYATKKESLFRYNNIFGKDLRGIVVNDLSSFDVDSLLDFFIAEEILKKKLVEI